MFEAVEKGNFEKMAIENKGLTKPLFLKMGVFLQTR